MLLVFAHSPPPLPIPLSTLNITIIGSLLTSAVAGAFAWKKGSKWAAPLPLLGVLGLYEVKHWFTPKAPLQSKYITFKDAAASKRWSGRKIPAATLTTLYLDGAIDFNMDVLSALESIDDFVCYMPSWPTIKFLINQLYPNSGNSSLKDKKTTKREIADHYDRGNDFFNAFLGPRMVYTSGVFETDEDTLETAQDNKMRKVRPSARARAGKERQAQRKAEMANLLLTSSSSIRSLPQICEKLRLKPGDKLLDIGCGWGTLVGYANRHFQAEATGVTLSKEGAAWSREHNKATPGKVRGRGTRASDRRRWTWERGRKKRLLRILAPSPLVSYEKYRALSSKSRQHALSARRVHSVAFAPLPTLLFHGALRSASLC